MLSFLRNKNLLFFFAGFSTALTISSLYLLRISDSQAHHRTHSKTMRNSLRRRKVLFFGDSITQHGFNTDIQGWVAKLGNWWTRRVDLLNRGYSGYNTRWAKQVIEDVVVNESPDFVFIFFGANDAVDRSVLQHVSLDEYRENMRYMANVVKHRMPGVPIVLITPPPVWEEKLQYFNKQKGKPLLIDRTNERTKEYVNAVIEIGKEASADRTIVDVSRLIRMCCYIV
jgi:lysophospholipase L1-like esterase